MEKEAKKSKHFSHEHPLEFVDQRFHKSRVCSGCKHAVGRNGFFYQCKICQFSLHKVCYAMPKEVSHPSDQNHNLTLQLPSSVSDQSNDCNACGSRIDGFYYSCTKCSIYCHMLCVALPLSVKIPSSHPHILKLELKPPYDFQCDLCDRPSYGGWLYRCELCEFDAHVSCAVKGTQSPHQRRGLDSKSYEHEVMELLSEVMKGTDVKNRDQDDQDHNHNQSVHVPEDFALPSYQFSDACFSLDISNFSHHHPVKAKKQSSDFGKKDSTGIGSHVWDELAPEDRAKLKDVENVRFFGWCLRGVLLFL